jgi:hypothetical protein
MRSSVQVLFAEEYLYELNYNGDYQPRHQWMMLRTPLLWPPPMHNCLSVGLESTLRFRIHRVSSNGTRTLLLDTGADVAEIRTDLRVTLPPHEGTFFLELEWPDIPVAFPGRLAALRHVTLGHGACSSTGLLQVGDRCDFDKDLCGFDVSTPVARWMHKAQHRSNAAYGEHRHCDTFTKEHDASEQAQVLADECVVAKRVQTSSGRCMAEACALRANIVNFYPADPEFCFGADCSGECELYVCPPGAQFLFRSNSRGADIYLAETG